MGPDLNYYTAYYRVKRANAASKGLCTHCFRKPAEPGGKGCPGCIAKVRKHMKARREEARKIGLCSVCCKREVVEGKRSCLQCSKPYRKGIRSNA